MRGRETRRAVRDKETRRKVKRKGDREQGMKREDKKTRNGCMERWPREERKCLLHVYLFHNISIRRG